MKEIWRDIAGFEGLYQVSNLARVKSFRVSKRLWNTTGNILKPCECAINNGKGYKFVGLHGFDKRVKHVMIHRLVAKTFIPNPDNKPQVNHKDADKHNNSISNLEWVTISENSIHAEKMGLMVEGRKLAMQAIMRPCIDTQTGVAFDGVRPACRALNIGYQGEFWRLKHGKKTRLQYA